jgi:hypothetical protein
MAIYSLTVPNKNGSYDGDMVVKQYSSLTVSSGNTLTVDQPCRGLLIYVAGDCTINGTLSMKGRGAAANPSNNGASDANPVNSDGLKFPFLSATGSETYTPLASYLNGCGTTARNLILNHIAASGNGKTIYVSRTGAAGGAQTGSGSPTPANAGANGTVGQSGGGGTGGGHYSGAYAAAGSAGTCFSGGTGSGGVHPSAGGTGNAAQPFGGAGGNGYYPDGGYSTPGGIGNPNGLWSSTNTYYGNNNTYNGNGGTGGLLILIVGGNLTIGASGKIEADGVAGPTFMTDNERAGGGSSGGGNVIVAYRGTLTNNGSITADGGTRWGWGNQLGGAGGNGSVQLLQVL